MVLKLQAVEQRLRIIQGFLFRGADLPARLLCQRVCYGLDVCAACSRGQSGPSTYTCSAVVPFTLTGYGCRPRPHLCLQASLHLSLPPRRGTPSSCLFRRTELGSFPVPLTVSSCGSSPLPSPDCGPRCVWGQVRVTHSIKSKIDHTTSSLQ